MKNIANKIIFCISLILVSIFISTSVPASEIQEKEENDSTSIKTDSNVICSIKYDSWSLSLGEGININFYYTVLDGDADSFEVYVNDKSVEKIYTQDDRSEFYICVPVSPKKLGDKLNLSFRAKDYSRYIDLHIDMNELISEIRTDSNVSHEIIPRHCLEKMYNDDFAGTIGHMSSYNDLKNLCKAIENYGYASQIYFNYKANEVPSYDGASFDEPGDLNKYKSEVLGTLPDGISYFGSSLIIKDKIFVRHYFEISDGASVDDYIFRYANEEVRPVEKSGMYYVQSKNLNVYDYSDQYVLNVEKKNSAEKWSLTYGPYSYMNKVREKGDNEKLWSLCKAIYLYNESLKNYLASSETSRKCGHENIREQEDGKYENRILYFCENCGIYLGSTVSGLSDPGHKHDAVLIERKESTCKESGYELYKCIECFKVEKTELPAKGHNYEWQIVKEATCGENGEKKEVCSECEDVGEKVLIPATNDHLYELTKVTNPSCVSAGKEEYTCTVCGAEDYRITGAETGHIPGEAVITKEATCTIAGERVTNCIKCGEILLTESIEAAHDFEWIKEDATEAAEGREYEKCRVCNATGAERVIPKKTHEHDYAEEITKEPTCIETGEKRIYCKNCDYSVLEPIQKTKHNFGPSVLKKAATCSEDGQMESKCVCGITWYTVIPKTGVHEYEHYSSSTAADPCVDTVIETYKCKYCNDSYTEEVVPPGHFYTTLTEKEATYESDGLKYDKCMVCGKIRPGSEVVIPKLKPEECTHPSYKRELVKKSTCISYSTYNKICTSCGEIIGTTRGAVYGDHDSELIKKQTIAPTIKEEGQYSYICPLCGKTVKTESIPKLTKCPHNGRVYEIELEDGRFGIYCCICDELLRIESKGGTICYHRNTKQVMNTAPTDTTNGIVDIVCADCGKKISTTTIHYYSTYTVDIGGGKTEKIYGYFDDDKAREVFGLLNEYRVEKGLNTLRWESNLDEAARIRAVESAHTFAHQRPNGEVWWILNPVYMNAENLAAGHTTAEMVMDGWKESSGHDANMRGPGFRSVNIACFKRYTFGTDPNRVTPIGETYFWVQEFSAIP